MIIYNVTVTVDLDIEKDWVEWMKTEHIPDVINTGCFEASRFCRIIKSGQEGVSYSIQYAAKDMATLHKYQVQFAAKLQKEHMDRYKDKALAFRTLMEVID